MLYPIPRLQIILNIYQRLELPVDHLVQLIFVVMGYPTEVDVHYYSIRIRFGDSGRITIYNVETSTWADRFDKNIDKLEFHMKDHEFQVIKRYVLLNS